MSDFFSYEEEGIGFVNTNAIAPNRSHEEFYREKAWLTTEPPPLKPPKLVLVVDDETHTVEDSNGITRAEGVYDDVYQEKVWHKQPVDYQTYWMGVDWACKDEIEFQPREPYDPPRKGRRGWNQPKPYHYMTARRPCMNYKRRRRHG